MLSERNSLCKTIAFLHELDSSRGYAWPALEETLRELALSTGNTARDRHDLYFTFIYENPAMVADTPLHVLVDNLRTGLLHINAMDHPTITALQAAVAVLQVDDRAPKMQELVPAILDVRDRAIAFYIEC